MRATEEARADRLFRLLIGTYLCGGLLNSMVNLLVPRLRLTMGLDYAQALCVHLAYYSSYLLFAVPITLCAIRIGYMRSIAIGLAVIAGGCLAFVAAMGGRSFVGVLLSLIVMSSGITFLQIAANAVITAFGTTSRMASRYTLLQAFNSLGTVLGPLIGAWFILGQDGAQTFAVPFAAGAAVLLVLALLFSANREMLPLSLSSGPAWLRLGALARTPRMQAGVLAIFAYVGAEVTIGTLAVSYLMLPGTAHVSAVTAGRLVSLYWAGAMLGRFAGAVAVKRMGAAPILSAASIGAMLLLAAAIGLQGWAGGVALLAIGLCNSVMFPLTYALALPDEEADVPIAAMLLCMAVVGGAVIPVLTGLTADRIGLVPALVVPGLCYAVLLAFAGTRDRVRPA